MSSDHDGRHEREAHRNEAAQRVRLLVRHEEQVRARTIERLAAVLVQRPEPRRHHFSPPAVQISPRRTLDIPDRPGGPSSDFEGAIA